MVLLLIPSARLCDGADPREAADYAQMRAWAAESRLPFVDFLESTAKIRERSTALYSTSIDDHWSRPETSSPRGCSLGESKKRFALVAPPASTVSAVEDARTPPTALSAEPAMACLKLEPEFTREPGKCSLSGFVSI